MRYTNCKIKWERCLVRVNEYGDVERVKESNKRKKDKPVTVLGRKQPKNELVKTSEGREILSRSIYYFDPNVERNSLSIKQLDLLDDEVVELVYVMCDLMNKPKMVKVVTV